MSQVGFLILKQPISFLSKEAIDEIIWAQAVLAHTFHWSPTELDKLTLDEIEMWLKQVNRINKETVEAAQHGWKS